FPVLYACHPGPGALLAGPGGSPFPQFSCINLLGRSTAISLHPLWFFSSPCPFAWAWLWPPALLRYPACWQASSAVLLWERSAVRSLVFRARRPVLLPSCSPALQHWVPSSFSCWPCCLRACCNCSWASPVAGSSPTSFLQR